MNMHKHTLLCSFAVTALSAGLSLSTLADNSVPGDKATPSAMERGLENTKEFVKDSVDKGKRVVQDISQNASEKYQDSKTRDAWLDGKLEFAYTVNRHLNPFRINTKVVDGVVTLSGDVESQIDKDLAEEVALGIDGISEVNNKLAVQGRNNAVKHTAAADKEDDKHEGRDFSQWFDDTTTTATVKSQLLANSNTEGLSINVDTANDVVTLSGIVKTSEEKDLAEKIAENSDGVHEVNNRLEVVAR